MLPATSVDAVVVGAGPVGMTVAHLLDAAGASTVVLEKRARDAAGRFTMPVIDERSHDILATAGLAGKLLDPRVGKQGVATRRIERVLRDEADGKPNIDVRYGASMLVTRHDGSRGIEVFVRAGDAGAMQAVRATLLVDATGGRLFTNGPLHLRPLPETTDMVIGRWPYQGHLGPLFDLSFGAPRGVFGHGKAKGIFGPNNAVDGAVGAMEVSPMRMGLALAQRFRDPRERQALYELGAREAGLGPHTIEGTQWFALRQQLAASARQGSIVSAGDSVGRVNFKTAQGLNSGIRDADRVRTLLQDLGATRVNDGAARDALFARYEHGTLEDHRRVVALGRARYYPTHVVPPPLRDFPELEPHRLAVAATAGAAARDATPQEVAIASGVPMSDYVEAFTLEPVFAEALPPVA